jgi:hypothetical protein
VSVKAFARRYGVDCYTAYADLIAIGFRLAPGDNRWAVRPAPAPTGRPPNLLISLLISMRVGSESATNACVVCYTPGGAPYGWIDNSIGGAEDGIP